MCTSSTTHGQFFSSVFVYFYASRAGRHRGPSVVARLLLIFCHPIKAPKDAGSNAPNWVAGRNGRWQIAAHRHI